MQKLILCLLLALPPAASVLAQNGAAEDQSRWRPINERVTRLMLTDTSFIKKAAAINLAEIEFSKLALKQSGSADIRAFAERMVRAHAAAAEELKLIAAAENIEVSAELDGAHQRAIEKLAALGGTELDNEFSKQMQEGHDRAVMLFSVAAEDESINPKLQQFAIKMLPILRGHQQAAHGLAGRHAAEQ